MDFSGLWDKEGQIFSPTDLSTISLILFFSTKISHTPEEQKIN